MKKTGIDRFVKTLLRCSREALSPTRKSAFWLLKLMVPISLGVSLMQHFGILAWMAQYLNPLFVYLGLPGSSAVIFMSGVAAGTYAGIAAMTALPLTMKQATIMAIMIALCHSLPMECAVNKKTGSSAWKMAVIRLFMAFVCAWGLNLLLPEIPGNYIFLGAPADSSFAQVLVTWLWSQVKMSAMVFLIIYVLMVVQQMIEAYALLKPLSNMLGPLMTVFGIPRHSAYMWLVGNVLGISYGSAVMLELESRGLIRRDEANDVNYHLIMNHSMLEDTIVFALTGISALWLMGTRVSCAMVLVWSRRLLLCVKKKRS